jgi:hypothetical protein
MEAGRARRAALESRSELMLCVAQLMFLYVVLELQSEALQQVRYKVNGTITIIASSRRAWQKRPPNIVLVYHSYSSCKNIALSILLA